MPILWDLQCQVCVNWAQLQKQLCELWFKPLCEAVFENARLGSMEAKWISIGELPVMPLVGKGGRVCFCWANNANTMATANINRGVGEVFHWGDASAAGVLKSASVQCPEFTTVQCFCRVVMKGVMFCFSKCDNFFMTTWQLFILVFFL